MTVLKYLVYTSQATFEPNDEDLQNILTSSCRNNAEADITGILLFRSNRFIQFREGSPERIDALMTVLNDDPRHRDVRVLIEESAAHRRFTDWRMGYRKLGAGRPYGGAGIRDSFSDLTQETDYSILSRAATEFSLWFKVKEGAGI